MKKLYSYLLVFLPIVFSAQSISASRLFTYSNSQNIEIISKELEQLGFQTRMDNSEGYPIYQFAKKTTRGTERNDIGSNSELFMVIYRPEKSIYEILKTKILTPDFKYSYVYKNAKYFENNFMRIGADDVNGIISIFKPLK